MVANMPEYFLAWRSRLMPSRMHQAHGAGVVVGPDRLGAVSLARPSRNASAMRSSASSQEMRCELARALRPVRRSGCSQAVGMVDALGIARDLGADDAGRVAVVLRRRARGRCVRPSSTSTSSAQVEGQSCGQAECRRSMRGGAFMAPVMPEDAPSGKAYVTVIASVDDVRLRVADGLVADDRKASRRSHSPRRTGGSRSRRSRGCRSRGPSSRRSIARTACGSCPRRPGRGSSPP